MKVAVIGANGKSGRLIVNKALEHGLDVTAVVRHANQTNTDKALMKDVFDLRKEDLETFDVVIDALGFWSNDELSNHKKALEHIIDLLATTKTKLYVVGGAGSLYVDDKKTLQLKDTPDFPKEFKPLADAMSEGLAILKKHTDLDWVYVSPAADFRIDGPATGVFKVAGDILVMNDEGQSQISYSDYAEGLIHELLSGNHLQTQISLFS